MIRKSKKIKDEWDAEIKTMKETFDGIEIKKSVEKVEPPILWGG